MEEKHKISRYVLLNVEKYKEILQKVNDISDPNKYSYIDMLEEIYYHLTPEQIEEIEHEI